MQIKIVVIDPELSPQARRRLIGVGLIGLVLTLAAVAFAAVPNPFESGQPISASAMNQNFVDLDQRLSELESNVDAPPQVPAGAVTAFAGSVLPEGWLWCDGQGVSKNEFPALFAAIGTTYGGTGSPMFNVPDYRGRFLRGLDEGAGRDPDSGSRELGSVQGDAFQGHWHVHSYKLSGKAPTGNEVSIPHWDYAAAGTDTNSIQNAVSDGSNGTPRVAAETRPSNIAVKYIIKH